MSTASPDDLMRQAAAHHAAARLDQAAALCEQVLSLQPNNVNAVHLKGMLAMRAGRLDQSIELLTQSASIAPHAAIIQHNLGQALRLAGRFDLAAAAYRKAISLEPKYAKAHLGLGLSLERAGDVRAAIEPLRTAVRLQPGFFEAWNALGIAYLSLKRRDESIEALSRAAALAPNDASPQYNLGKVLHDAGQFDRAAEALKRAIALNPSHAAAHQNLANLLGESGRIDDAMLLQRRAIELAPTDTGIASNLLLSLHYSSRTTPELSLDEHKRWAARHGKPNDPPIVHRNHRSPDQRLRIGYLSPDYNRHPVASFLENVLAGHDRSQFEVFAYSNSTAIDDMTKRLRGLVDHWRDIATVNDDAAAKLIVDDQIDVLIDLAGHTGNNRAPLMARGAAPVEFTYLGYPATTGIPAVQYRITDAIADPLGMTESHHTEALVRLPDCFLCYRPDDDAPPTLDATPAQKRGHVTFGSFNNFAKITDEMLNYWATIVHAVPKSRMLLKARALDSSDVRQRVIDIFTKHDVDSDRVQMAGWTSYDQRHAIVASADIALDSFPYHGTTTTCETLWLGVPWITLAGRTHVSRVSASILSVIGCPELVANSADEYSAKAIELANDLPRMNDYRTMLRAKMQASPLLDRKNFVAKLEHAYRDAWRKWCSS
ncbi:MAG: tetratricopeptide repeat protein [Anaerolineae bacterium]|nr:tetratricopeptide repeat protein [Phycisphaerae bacterium]